ncbi:MAG: CBS domain-containing protein [bacterium]|nr:CBS domain-containing protein [bacterium]
MQVVDMMRKTVHTATADMSLAQAQHRMQEHRVRHLPVVAQTHLIGLLTDRDLRDALPSAVTTLGPAEIAQLLDTIAVETCMTTPVKTISSTADAVDAAHQLLQTHYGCLPVVDDEKLVGIVTELDMLRGFLAAAVPAGDSLTVKDYMHTELLTVTPEDFVHTAHDRMQEARIRHLPVVTQEQKLVGIVTDRDVRQASASRLAQFDVYEAPEQLEALQVQRIMTTPVLTVQQDTPVADAGQRLLEQRLGCLPVVRAGNVVEGIITVTDLISAYVQL